MTTPWSRWALWVAVALLAFAVQTSRLSPISVWGARPDLVLVVVVAFALHFGPVQGGAVGLIAGFVVDLYGGRLIGMGGLAKLAAGAAGGLIGQKVFREHAIVRAAVVLVSSVVGNLVYLALARAFGLVLPVFESVYRVILPSALSDTAAGFVLYPLLFRLLLLSDRLEERLRTGSVEG